MTTTFPEQVSSLTAPVDGRSRRTTSSCFSCRHKKLKCDRARPCSNCVKRSLSCAYANPADRPAQNRGGNVQLYSRIQHLEELLATFVTDRNAGNASDSDAAASIQPTSLMSGSSSSDQGSNAGAIPIENANKNSTTSEKQKESDGQEESLRVIGHMRISDSEMTYVSATHWAAIRENITSIRECIEAEDGQHDPTQALFEGPSLLLGICNPSNISDILNSMPPRSTVDRLVSRFFNSSVTCSVLILHIPTFQHEYDHFWTDPHGTPITWISLLFSIMSLGVYVHLRSGENPPNMAGGSDQAIFRLRAVECLILGNYTKPKAYTIEALLLHIQSESFYSETAQTSVWVLWGVLVRLALFIGLHRDSKYYPEISCFEGEMRRRKWAMITEFDLLISYQAGLPRMIREGEGDTEPPHNLLDEDFDKTSSELPLPRSDREVTPISYSIYKGKISHVFGLIADQVSSIKPPSTDSLMELDRQLSEAYSCVPLHLQFRNSNRSVTDSPNIIIKRYTIDILYHKACCLLHRGCFHTPPSNPQYHYSRNRRLNSATQLLKHQTTINQEVQPGGLLYRNKWFASSLMSHNFLLAAMIVCLELQREEKGRSEGAASTLADHEDSSNGEEVEKTHGREELLQALQISHDIWSLSAPNSKVAANASQALAVMLGKVKIRTADGINSFGFTAANNTWEGTTATEDNSTSLIFGSNGENFIPTDQETMFPSASTFNPTSSGMMPGASGSSHPEGTDGAMDMEFSNIDWRLWDSQIQNFGMHSEWTTE